MTDGDSPRVLLITGASRGIGAATARLAAQRGYSVCINYQRDEQAAQKVAGEIQNNGGTAIAVQADVSVEPDVIRLFESVDRELGPLSALVNNAGTLESQMRVDAMDAARLQRIFAINVIGTILCAREAVRRMSTRYHGRGGSIVNLSSAVVRYGAPGELVDYAASKGAIDVFTLGLAREVAEEGIRVNAVSPGLIHTDIHLRTGEPGRVERIANSIPMKRGGQPEEVAAAILWMLSDEASYVTGAVLNVAGGR